VASDKATFEAYLDLRQVDAALQKTRAEVDSTVTANGRLAGSMTKIEQGAKMVQQRAGTTAGAISGLTAATGESAGAMGKAVAGAGQLAGAWAAGGPLMAAVAGLGVALNLLQKHWDSVIEKQDKAIKKAYEATDKATAVSRSVSDQLFAERQRANMASLTGSDRELAQLRFSLGDETKKALAQMASTDATIQRLGRNTLNNINEIIQIRAKTLQIEGAAKDAAKGGGAKGTDFLLDGAELAPQDMQKKLDAAQDVIDKSDAQIAAAREEEEKRSIAHWRSLDAARIASRKNADQVIDAMRMDDLEKQEAALAKIRQGYESVYIGAVSGATSSAASSVQQYLDGIITGEEHAAEKALASFLKSTGGQLVGIGTKAIFEGAAISANPLTPGAGLPLMGIGAAAVAAGLAMGAGGTAMGHTAAGGQVGKPLQSGGAPERGVGAGTGGGGRSGSGGQVVFINNYGVYGPSAEDSAREQTRMARTARRRGIV
jgi:hypothetical protein